VNPEPSLRRSQELPGSGGFRCGLGGSLCCGVDALAFDAIFRTEQSSCTAIPCSSIAQDSSETAIPHIQQVKGGSEPDTTMRLQLAPIDPWPANGGREELLHRRADGRLPAGAYFSLSDLESGQGVSAILKLRSVFGNTHFRAVRVQSQLCFPPTSCDPGLRVHGAGDLFRCREMFGRISVAKLDRYGRNLFGARRRCWYWKISNWIRSNTAPKGRSGGRAYFQEVCAAGIPNAECGTAQPHRPLRDAH
jgi:hypothetical protein